MDIFVVLLLICIIICIFFLWYITSYNKFQGYIIRINEAEANIDATLRKRFDLLTKAMAMIKVLLDTKKEVLGEIANLRSKKLTNFELDRKLVEGINEFHKLKEEHEVLKASEEFFKIELALNETETEMFAFRKYYNDIITEYNKMIRTFPSTIVGKFCKYQERTYFDGKNMNDAIYNDFKL